MVQSPRWRANARLVMRCSFSRRQTHSALRASCADSMPQAGMQQCSIAFCRWVSPRGFVGAGGAGPA
eukprot:15461049-Alexandrium_andersonii.AAC.1